MSVPITVPLSNNSTRSIPVVGLVVAVTTRVEPAGIDVGVIARITERAVFATTLTGTAVETAIPPAESVAVAVSEISPGTADAGHEMEKGGEDREPIGLPFAKNCTFVMESPLEAVALAVTVTFELAATG